MWIGSNLTPELEAELVTLLRENAGIFTWEPANMLRILREIVEHWLNVEKLVKPVKQKL